MRATSDNGPTIMQVKITLVGISKPPVWRRVLVPADIRLDRLHEVIQAAMGWTDTHLHVFTSAISEYGPPDPELGHRDERAATLVQLLTRLGDRLRYTYDFGDDWEHVIVLEKILAAEPGVVYPTCIAGRSVCPPEDCGGAWGYGDLREALGDPAHEDHEAMLDWLGFETGSEFDPAVFDIEQVNESLACLSTTR